MYSIVAQHFEADNTKLPFSNNSIAALRHVAELQQTGKLLVAGTARLLQYNLTHQYVAYKTFDVGDKVVIDITEVRDPLLGTTPATLNAVRGLTFYVSDPAKTEIEVAGKLMPNQLIQRHLSDGRHPSLEIAWWTTH